MSTFSPHHCPQPSDVDRAAEMREARWEALKARLDWDAIAAEFLAQLKVRLNCRHHPVAQAFSDLEASPVEDSFELEGLLQHTPSREKVRLGEAVLRLMGEAQLQLLQQLDDRPF
jgi:hypothetical protein